MALDFERARARGEGLPRDSRKGRWVSGSVGLSLRLSLTGPAHTLSLCLCLLVTTILVDSAYLDTLL